MIRQLRERQRVGKLIKVGLIGAGSMGKGIAEQIQQTMGMQLEWIADIRQDAAARVAALTDCPRSGIDPNHFIDNIKVDVLVEASTSISAAFGHCCKALDSAADVLLMNAEVDLAMGLPLNQYAESRGQIVTSDAGDQHGVLARMIDEANLWGLEIVQAGNIKGFLQRHATVNSITEEARQRRLNVNQCCAYTDGTKLHIEMALLCNGYGLLPPAEGMSGPQAKHVSEAIELFDFDSYQNQPRVDYILGAEPGGGVYLIVKATADQQIPFLEYYKLGNGPYYLLYRPYHLCHFETISAIAQLVLYRRPVLQPWAGRNADVYTYAKTDLAAGTCIYHAIGQDTCYGMIGSCAEHDSKGYVPICAIDDNRAWVLRNNVEKDTPLVWDDFDYPETHLTIEYVKMLHR
ncbi:MAG: putative homoserine dehydrogenase-like protein [Parasphingorhabdus sp.]|jgi:predicted homoserine dehydrogenase-like protein